MENGNLGDIIHQLQEGGFPFKKKMGGVGLLGSVLNSLTKNRWKVNSPKPGRRALVIFAPSNTGDSRCLGTFSWPEIRGVSFLVEWFVVPISFH